MLQRLEKMTNNSAAVIYVLLYSKLQTTLQRSKSVEHLSFQISNMLCEKETQVNLMQIRYTETKTNRKTNLINN